MLPTPEANSCFLFSPILREIWEERGPLHCLFVYLLPKTLWEVLLEV